MKGDIGLKKIASIAFCILLLCSLCLTVGTALATAPGYEFMEYFAIDIITVDGKWTVAEEWSAGEIHYMGTPQKALWAYLMDSLTTGIYSPAFLVEFADSTQDAGDIIQLCMNGAIDSTAPTAGEDFKMEIQGLTTKKVYEGTGSGWAESSTALAAVQMAATVTTSAHDSSPHVVAEFVIDKGMLSATWGANPPPEGVRVACYDASSDTWLSWPPESSADNPSTWGLMDGYSQEPFPEGLTIGVMLALSSVAAVVSLRYFKKPKL